MTTPDTPGAHPLFHGADAGAKRRWKLLVWALLVILLVAYVGSVPGQLFPKPDTLVYLGLARSLAHGDGYTFNLGPYGKYPPVFPALLAAGNAVGGVWGMQALVALCGVGALVAAYVLVKARAGSRVALAVVAMSATCTWFWSHASALLLAEVPFALFSLLALMLAERAIRSEAFSVWSWLLCGVVTAVAVCTHIVGVVLLPAIVAGVLLAKARRRSTRQRVLATVMVATLGVACAVGWYVRGRSLPGMSTYSVHVAEMVARADEAGDKLRLRLREYTAAPLSLSYKQVTNTVGVGVFLLLVLPGLVEGFRRYRSCAEFYLCGHYVVSAIMGGDTGHERYVVPVIPLLFYYGCLSLRALTGWLASELELRRRLRGEDDAMPARWPHRVVIWAMVAVLAYGLLYRVRGTRGGKVFSARGRAKAEQLDGMWRQVGQWAAEMIPAEANVCAGSGGSWCFVHYYTQRHVDAPLETSPTVPQVVAQLVQWDSDFVVSDHREFTQVRLWPTLALHPECFERLAANDECALYRVDKAALRAVHAQPEEQDTQE